jgi:hypothetical protein
MCVHAGPVTVAAMSPDSSVKVVIDLERCGQTIGGDITVAGQGTAAFFGWLELIDRVERAIEEFASPGGAGVDPP